MNVDENDIRSFHIVDDDELARYLVKRCSGALLKQASTYEYNSGESFLDFLDKVIVGEIPQSEIQHAIVTMDLRMPGVGGLEALKGIQDRIRAGKLTDKPFYCLVLTSSNSQKDKDEVQKYSFVSRYLVKPLTVGVLSEIVSEQGRL